MWMFVLRRSIMAVLTLLVTSFIVYQLMDLAGDPLADLRSNPSPNRDALIRARTELLNLDTPAPMRYLSWITGAFGCLVPGMACDLGSNLDGQPVSEALGQALTQTLRMVVLAALLAMIVGTTLGIIMALRQYTTFDYTGTLVVFLFFSLPSFWLAVLLKEFVAFRFNNFLRDPTISIPMAIAIGLVVGLSVAGGVGGDFKKQAMIAGIGTVSVAGILQAMSFSGWFTKPSLGFPVLAVVGAATAFGFTALIAGLRNKRALYTGLAMVGVGLALYLPIQPILDNANFLILVGLGLAAIVVGVAAGHFFGGYDRGQNRAVGGFVAFIMGLMIVLDKYMLHWQMYTSNSRVRGRPMATSGAGRPGLEGNFWIEGIDIYAHVLLPTMSMTLVGIAMYARYSRATMLEVMNQDYVRTARAKGLPERAVIVQHAFRNALVPIATVAAMAIGGIVGGAIITEQVFGWSGIGTMFFTGLLRTDPNPVMGVFLLTSTMTLVFLILADLMYSVLDPRVRVK